MKTNERYFIAGATGGGKSYLAAHLTAKTKNLIVYDVKREVEIPKAKIITKMSELKKAGAGRYVYRPSARDIADKKTRQEFLNEWFKIIYYCRNRVIWIDELYEVAESALVMPHYLRSIYTQGRSMNIGVVGITQRPAFIPGFCMSEAEHAFVFQLRLPQDKKRVHEYIGGVNFRALKTYEFAYLDMRSQDSPTISRI